MKNFKLLTISLTFAALFLSVPLFSQVISIDRLFCENRENPLGIENINPKLTWVLSSDGRNKKQSAYQVQVSENPDNFTENLIWDSKKVKSGQSVHVAYQGDELNALDKYYWRVKVWDENNKSSGWSNTAFWQMGVLDRSDWKAKWIGVGYEEEQSRPGGLMRNEFNIDKKIRSATAIITSHGLYQAFLNGSKIGDAYLTPGWTSYNKRLQYQVYDVTGQLKPGKNAVGAILGDGWYRGPLTWGERKDLFGSELALLLQINVTYADGTTEVFSTNNQWKSAKSSILNSEIYNGETIDARKIKTGWNTSDYDAGEWVKVKEKQYGYDNLVATYNEPVRKQETFKPVKMLTTPEGDKVLDFGQNLVGFVEVEITGKAGDSLVLEHAEVLDKDGNFYTENLRAAKQKNVYILSGRDNEKFEPHFTWQGFRYVRLKGNVPGISADNFTAVALYSDMRKTGTFKTSDKLLNQLQHNIQWGQRGNFLDVPTDCPQRDERLGWTGDAQVFSKTAAFNMHVDNFFTKWMQDVAADQLQNGSVTHVVPNVLGPGGAGSAGWADVATIIPWDMYLLYGNTEILKNQYESMKGWVNYMNEQSKDYLWNSGFHYGDWLFYRPDDDNDGRAALTDKYLIAQCFFAHSTQLLVNTAEVLGKDEDVKKYSSLLHKIKEAFLKEYMTPNGRLVSSSQTAYVLALNFDMFPENLREQAAERLVNNIKSYGYHLTTGFLGTPYLCFVLSEFGYHDLAYTLLMQQTYPSWLYPVTAGATTIWERWDGRKPDGTFQTPGMNSFNHYAYGAIGDWMYRELAGINSSEKINEVGYKKIVLKPHLDNKYESEEVEKQNKNSVLDEVNASLETYYGTIVSHWEIDGERKTFDIKIPVNTTAEIHLPSNSIAKIKENNKPLSSSKDIKIVDEKPDEIVISVGSGHYNFSMN
ncbi:alpha-L-rhamnosidase [Sinomicrobium weinanense]|uniref:alpha-L-rhamnosidase n=1 Tax=Sinomicrobium weinanense TaxID=2842200 RepID=A0A926Q3P6_9FLAO|nr:alpha-L-rhamnosidase [Sinomicrobium weinanense]MBC9797154.1 family 78 glycoside hydrolase catalytic domain [Sinomicrobium weinanense]MBU3124495.1 glycoside hydrolase family 78 protein [Sinomicrobium weinanense]